MRYPVDNPQNRLLEHAHRVSNVLTTISQSLPVVQRVAFLSAAQPLDFLLHELVGIADLHDQQIRNLAARVSRLEQRP